MFELVRRLGPWFWLGWRIIRGHFFLWHRLRILGVENVPLTGGLILACNHISHLDPPAIGAATPRRSSFVAKEELFHQFFLSWYLPSVGMIPLRRGGGGKSMLEEAANAVREGRLVTMFPEGTRSTTGYPGKPRTGVIVLAGMTGAPVLPVRVSGSFDCMPPGALFPRPGLIQVAFGKPMHWAPGELENGNRDQLVVEVNKVMAAILDLPGWHPRKARIPPEEIVNNESQATSEGG